MNAIRGKTAPNARVETNDEYWALLSPEEQAAATEFREQESATSREAMKAAQRATCRTAPGTPEHAQAVKDLHLRTLLAIALGGESKRLLRRAGRLVLQDLEG